MPSSPGNRNREKSDGCSGGELRNTPHSFDVSFVIYIYMIAGGDGTENKRRVFRRRAQEHPPLHCILDLYSQDNWRQSRRDVKGMTSRVEQLQLRKKWRTMFDLNETPVI